MRATERRRRYRVRMRRFAKGLVLGILLVGLPAGVSWASYRVSQDTIPKMNVLPPVPAVEESHAASPSPKATPSAHHRSKDGTSPGPARSSVPPPSTSGTSAPSSPSGAGTQPSSGGSKDSGGEGEGSGSPSPSPSGTNTGDN